MKYVKKARTTNLLLQTASKTTLTELLVECFNVHKCICQQAMIYTLSCLNKCGMVKSLFLPSSTYKGHLKFR